ncbi:c-type cytochrome [Hylemonella gracilis]|uniref:c-type cytochrome n=1 Tax=Hylemonella gracilis TaxID=80880 RepID=UPI001A950028|nr:cytochrome c [Hylemonella gracilis]
MALKFVRRIALLLLATALALITWLAWPARLITVEASAKPLDMDDKATIERGRYLAVLGNCQACHTTRGSPAFAGGPGIVTPFGTIHGGNLTPGANGLGAWSADDFWRALHHGQSRDGRWLSPAFPYNNTTWITRPDSDTLYAYLRSLPPAETQAPPPAMRWPYNTQFALKAWRALYFTPAPQDTAQARGAPNRSAEVLRGAYLVQGFGHCAACHAPRNTLGGGDLLSLAGGLIPMQNWYAPSLLDPSEGGLQEWDVEKIVALFRDGHVRGASMSGPMGEVVQQSTQHWQADDLRSLAAYLRQLPVQPARSTATQVVQPRAAAPASDPRLASQRRYQALCAQCHGQQGEGKYTADGAMAYPPLAGNRAVLLDSPANLVQMVRLGGFGPATAAHPRPFGMPPFLLELNDGEVADLLSYIRSQWGNRAKPVHVLEVQRLGTRPASP